MTAAQVSLLLVTHDPAILQRFGAVGEMRLVFAQSDRAGIVLMPDGDAEAFRARAKAGELFRCVVPDCEAPSLSIVNRGERRHGFSHRAGAGGHAPMGVAHLTAQLLIRDWLRERYPDATVDLEVTTEDGLRRADVMYTSATGRQAAFEIQYAGITPAAWQARHDDYAAKGIRDIWLRGHLLPQFRTHRREEGHVALNPTLEAVAAAGQPIMWINPVESLIGFATTEVRRWDTEPHRLLTTREHGQFEAHPLDEFRLSAEHGMTSDRLRELFDTPARIEREKVRKRLEAETAAERKRATLEVYLTRMDELAHARAVVWASSPVRTQTLQQAGGVWPPFLGLPTHLPGPTLIRLPIPAEEWQTRLWNKHIRGKAHGTRVHLWKLKLDLEQMHPDIRVAEAAAANWIGQLIDHGVIDRKNYSS